MSQSEYGKPGTQVPTCKGSRERFTMNHLPGTVLMFAAKRTRTHDLQPISWQDRTVEFWSSEWKATNDYIDNHPLQRRMRQRSKGDRDAFEIERIFLTMFDGKWHRVYARPYEMDGLLQPDFNRVIEALMRREEDQAPMTRRFLDVRREAHAKAMRAALTAARELVCDALDSVPDIHPCDEHDDAIRAERLCGPVRALHDALKTMKENQSLLGDYAEND